MSRLLLVTGALRFTAPFAIGGGEPAPGTDRPLLRDDGDRPALPGTTIAGALRGPLERLAPHADLEGLRGNALVEDLFGSALDHARGGTPSHLAIADATPLGDVAVSVRDGVGIDRASGAARKAIKYDLEIAGVGARYQLELALDLEHGEKTLTAGDRRRIGLLALGLSGWTAGRGSLGGRAGTGLGAFVLEDLDARLVDLTDPEVLSSWLRARPDAGERRDLVDGQPLGDRFDLLGHCPALRGGAAGDGTSPGQVRVTVALDAPDPLLIAGLTPLRARPEAAEKEQKVEDADAQPLTRPTPGGGAEAVLSGSAARGVLRSRVERIVRTFAGPRWQIAACDPHRKEVSCAVQAAELHEATRNDSPAERRTLAPKLAADVRRKVCPACRLFGNAALGGRVVVEEVVLSSEPPAVLDHVAVDRFTGGAADARKFDAAPLPSARAVTVVSVDRPARWEVALLLLALRDLCDGWVALGSRGTRGYGRVLGRVERIDLHSTEDGPLALLCDGREGAWRVGSLAPSGPGFLDGIGDTATELLDAGVTELEACVREWCDDQRGGA